MTRKLDHGRDSVASNEDGGNGAPVLPQAACCMVCRVNIAEILFEPCHHYKTCSPCALNVGRTCPACQGQIRKYVKAGLAPPLM